VRKLRSPGSVRGVLGDRYSYRDNTSLVVVLLALVPHGKQGEFFGFYNMMGKFAAVLGPLLVGATALFTGSTRLGILSIIVLFAGGAALLAHSRPES